MGYKHLQFDKDSVFLVTGGAGFIGSNLCEAILDMGYQVRCLDDLSTGSRKTWRCSLTVRAILSLRVTSRDLEDLPQSLRRRGLRAESGSLGKCSQEH